MTRTRLSTFCDGMVEACLLLAVVGVPLFFSPYSVRIFEPDKVYLLRCLSLLIVLFWTVSRMESGFDDLFQSGQSGRSVFLSIVRTPLVLPVLFLVLSFLLSAILSVSPRVSFFGSYDRLQGVVTVLSYVVAFFAVLDTIRTREQIDRVIQGLVMTSVPISVYAILQHFDIDVLPWMEASTERTGSAMGNPIFLGAYLAMVVPVTIYRILATYLFRPEKSERRQAIYFCAGNGLILCLQGLALLFTQSRGPWFGTAAAVLLLLFVGLIHLSKQAGFPSNEWKSDILKSVVFSFATLPVGAIPAYIYCLVRRKGLRWLWISLVIQMMIGLVLGGFLVSGKVSGSFLARVPYLSRLAGLSDVDSGTGKVRLLLWQGANELIRAKTSRLPTGYGPETFKYVWSSHTPAELLRYESRKVAADRSHNATLDLLAMTGLIGCCAFYSLVVLTIYHAFRWLGFMRSRRDLIVYIACLAVSVSGVAIASFLSPKLSLLSGLLLPAAILGGSFLSLLLSLKRFFTDEESDADPGKMLLVLVLFCGIIAHFVEIQVGIPTTAAQLYMFLFMALAVIVGTGRITAVRQSDASPGRTGNDGKERKNEGRQKKRKKGIHSHLDREDSKPLMSSFRPGPALPVMVIVSYILAILLFEYVTNPYGRTNLFSIIWSSLTTARAKGQLISSIGVLPVFGATLLFGFFVLLEGLYQSAFPRRIGATDIKSAILPFLLFLIPPFLFASVHASMTGTDGNPGGLIIGLFVMVIIMAFLMTALFSSEKPHVIRFFNGRKGWVYPVPVILCVWAGLLWAVRPAMADVYCKIGTETEQAGYFKESKAFLTRAIALSPDQDRYYLMLSRTIFNMAARLGDKTERRRYSLEALAVLEQARLLAPLDFDHFINLGVVSTQLAVLAPDEGTKEKMFFRAHESYQRAVELAPNKPLTHNYWAQTSIIQGDYETARKRLETSLAIDDRYVTTYIALGDLSLMTGHYDRAIEAYWKAIERAPHDWIAIRDVVTGHGRKNEPGPREKAILASVAKDRRFALQPEMASVIRFRLGERSEALKEMERLVLEQPANNRARITLASIYEASGRFDLAFKTVAGITGTMPEDRAMFVKKYLEILKGSLGRQSVKPLGDPARR